MGGIGDENMNIMVFDVPADDTGALSILNDFYNEALVNPKKDINWYFIISSPQLKTQQNLRVLSYPWIKKSWFHRLFFDQIIANSLIKNYKIDKVLSLQNIIIPHTNIPQTLYVHQSLPFVEYRFKFSENRLFWIYQNIIGKMIKRSILKAEKVIVQTKWMMEACISQTAVNSKKIKVVPPKINIHIDKRFTSNKCNLSTFFYPANKHTYKNHKIIIEASKQLKEKGIEDYRIILTLNGDEDNHIIKLYNEVVEYCLPIDFIGKISIEEVFELYTRSILIFPSYIETYGLPMMESRLHRGIVFASDLEFSREVLRGYENSYFFDPFDSKELSRLMEDVILGEIKYKEIQEDDFIKKNHEWEEFIKELVSKPYIKVLETR